MKAAPAPELRAAPPKHRRPAADSTRVRAGACAALPPDGDRAALMLRAPASTAVAMAAAADAPIRAA
eukprot:scaffold790_cov387-Prasinococcus_capsulatus_cf.AAC.12